MIPWSLSGFTLRQGNRQDRRRLLQFMHFAYREDDPNCPVAHLGATLDQNWSEKTPVWFVQASETPEPTESRAYTASEIACLWLGRAIDQGSGQSYTHVFLIFVHPHYRRQGIGRALMNHAEDWARAQGAPQIGLQVLNRNLVGQQFYSHLGYQTHALALLKAL